METGAVIIANPPQSYAHNPSDIDLLISQSLVDNLIQIGIREIVVISHFDNSTIKNALKRKGVVFIDGNENHSYAQDVITGIYHLMGKCNRIFFTSPEAPLISFTSISRLIADSSSLTIPILPDYPGFPFAISATLFANVLSLKDVNEINDIFSALNISPQKVSIDGDEPYSYHTDIDSSDVYSLLYDDDRLRPLVSVKLAKTSAAIGPGLIILLKQIQTFGSVREACKKTTISYSKSWSMIRAAEEALGILLVQRSVGGAGGGKSSLTPTAISLIAKYELFEAKVKQAANEIFKDIFDK